MNQISENAATNIIRVFQRSVFRVQNICGLDPSRIKYSYLTSSEIDAAATLGARNSLIFRTQRLFAMPYSKYKQLYEILLHRTFQLCSKGTIVSDTAAVKVRTKNGETITSASVINALEEIEIIKNITFKIKYAAVASRKHLKYGEITIIRQKMLFLFDINWC